MKITQIIAHEIFDSRAIPTVACTIILDNHIAVQSAVPSGTSTGNFEAYELRDGESRLFGLGVQKAVENINSIIAPTLIGKCPDVVEIDTLLCELDGTENKSKLGANAILAVSMAACRAQAIENDLELYELIAELMQNEEFQLPCPLFNMINGGEHTNNNLDVQEFLVAPVGALSFSHAFEIGATIYLTLKNLLRADGFSTNVGLEGGFAPNFDSNEIAFAYIHEAVKKNKYENIINFGMDVAASYLYNPNTKLYRFEGSEKSIEELAQWYTKLTMTYPFLSIEDGAAATNIQHWKVLQQQLPEEILRVSDDLTTTNAERIYTLAQENIMNGCIIKPNQIGTVTETLQAVQVAKEYKQSIIVSHRSGETCDTFIADLAVGVGANAIKSGAPCHSERVAKYNRLLEIERHLADE